MKPTIHPNASGGGPRPPLRIGFMPLTDCAPIVMAHELGIYGKFGLHVQLRREREWATLRDKLINGEVDAIQALATMPFALQLGLHCEPCACVTGMVLSLQGNAITLSEDLRRRGVVGGPSLRREVFRTFGRKTLTFGVPSATSTHTLLLRHWLKSAQINPDHHVRIIALSPLEMYPNLKLGNLDGFCVGEPWSSLAVDAGVGFCVATSTALAPLHPEKVLLVRRDFAEDRADEHLRLIAALLESCRFCDDRTNWGTLRSVLTHPNYVNAPVECLLSELDVPVDARPSVVRAFHDQTIFHRHYANDQSPARADWIIGELVASGLVSSFRVAALYEELRKTFRRDLYCEALELVPDEIRLAVNN